MHSTHARDLREILPVKVGTAPPKSHSRKVYVSDVAWMTAAKMLSFSSPNPSWNSLEPIIRDTLHATYEDCKLSTLAWNCLQPLGVLLHALCTDDSGCVKDTKDVLYSQHYASDLGLTCNNMQMGELCVGAVCMMMRCS